VHPRRESGAARDTAELLDRDRENNRPPRRRDALESPCAQTAALDVRRLRDGSIDGLEARWRPARQRIAFVDRRTTGGGRQEAARPGGLPARSSPSRCRRPYNAERRGSAELAGHRPGPRRPDHGTRGREGRGRGGRPITATSRRLRPRTALRSSAGHGRLSGAVRSGEKSSSTWAGDEQSATQRGMLELWHGVALAARHRPRSREVLTAIAFTEGTRRPAWRAEESRSRAVLATAQPDPEREALEQGLAHHADAERTADDTPSGKPGPDRRRRSLR